MHMSLSAISTAVWNDDKVATFTIEGDRVLGEFTASWNPSAKKGNASKNSRPISRRAHLQTYEGVKDLLAKRGNAKVTVENSQNFCSTSSFR